MENVLITGASGFIGSNLASYLSKKKYRVKAFIRTDSFHPFIDQLVCEKVYSNLADLTSLKKVLSGVDIVFHTAGYISFKKSDFDKAYQINVSGTHNVLEACLAVGVAKVVHLSACAVLGYSMDKNTILDETSNPKIERDNVYAYTKKLAEEEVQKYVKKGLNVSIANIATVYGQGDRNLNSGTIIKSIYEGKIKLIPPGGTSFVSVDDLVEGLILLAQKGRLGERYIFCTENIKYNDLFRRIAKVLEVKAPSFVLPKLTYYPILLTLKCIEPFLHFSKNKVNLMTTQIIKESFGYKYYSSKKAIEELGWRPLQCFEETVEEALNYYRENQLV